MPKVLFRFVKQVARLAQRYSAAGLNTISHARGHGFAGWKHIVFPYLRIHMEASVPEIVDWAEEMDRIRAVLNLEFGEFPHYSTLYKSFDRMPMSIWRGLLSGTADLLELSGHAAIDATYFRRWRASQHYLNRTGRSARTVQATFLVDTASNAITDLHCSTKWPSGMRIGPKVALRNAEDLQSLAADKGYDDQEFRENLRDDDVRPLIKHREFKPYDHAHNARIDEELYHQRSMTESVNSSIKRSYGSSLRSQRWYRQFREIAVIAGVHNVERAVKQDNPGNSTD